MKGFQNVVPFSCAFQEIRISQTYHPPPKYAAQALQKNDLLL